MLPQGSRCLISIHPGVEEVHTLVFIKPRRKASVYDVGAMPNLSAVQPLSLSDLVVSAPHCALASAPLPHPGTRLESVLGVCEVAGPQMAAGLAWLRQRENV